jgi:hypothetical protein
VPADAWRRRASHFPSGTIPRLKLATCAGLKGGRKSCSFVERAEHVHDVVHPLRRALDDDRFDASLLERDRRRETTNPRSDNNRTHASSLRRTAAKGGAVGGAPSPVASNDGQRYDTHRRLVCATRSSAHLSRTLRNVERDDVLVRHDFHPFVRYQFGGKERAVARPSAEQPPVGEGTGAPPRRAGALDAPLDLSGWAR